MQPGATLSIAGAASALTLSSYASHNASHHTNSALTSCPHLAMVPKTPRRNSGAVPKLDPLKSGADAVSRKLERGTIGSGDDRIVTMIRRGRKRRSIIRDGLAGRYENRSSRSGVETIFLFAVALPQVETRKVRKDGIEIPYFHNENSAAKVLLGMERPAVVVDYFPCKRRRGCDHKGNTYRRPSEILEHHNHSLLNVTVKLAKLSHAGSPKFASYATHRLRACSLLLSRVGRRLHFRITDVSRSA